MSSRETAPEPTEVPAVAQAAALHQPSLLEQIIEETKISPSDEGYGKVREGVQALLKEVLTSRKPGERVDRKIVDAMIAELDRRISKQMDEILHHKSFQALESAWRGLKFLVDRTDFRENIQISLAQAKKEELVEDFEDAPEVAASGLYRHIYTAEYGQFGGKPYGAIVGNYEFGTSARDMALLRNCAAVAAMSHAPFLAAAHPEFFGSEQDDYRALPYLQDLEAHFEGPKFAKWQGFRESEDSRYVGLALPRFLARVPYQVCEGGVKNFRYDEDVEGEHGNYVWANAAFALASRITDSFAKYRWCPNIIGPRSGGAVLDLPVHSFEAMGDQKMKIPTEVLVSERREFELSEQGFIALTMRKDSDNACFFSANSAQAPKTFGNSSEGKKAETNWRLGTQLPYLFIASRLAHYIKVLQREHIGSWKSRSELQSELNKWINQYVVDMESPQADVRSRRPLRQADIQVADVPGNAGWYKIDMKIVPHLKYMGGFFTLSLVGKLEKE